MFKFFMDGGASNYATKLGLSSLSHRRLKSMDQNVFIAKRSSLLENSFIKHEKNCAEATTCGGSNIFTPREHTDRMESARVIQETASKSPLSVRESSESGYKAVRDPSIRYQMTQSLSLLQFGAGPTQSQSCRKDEYAQNQVRGTQFDRMHGYKFTKDQEAPRFRGDSISRSIILPESNYKEGSLINGDPRVTENQPLSPDNKSVVCSVSLPQNHFLIPSKHHPEDKAGVNQTSEETTACLYAQVGLMMMEMKRLHWKLNNQPSATVVTKEDYVSRQVYLDLENKFNNVLKKYTDSREEFERQTLELSRTTKDLKSRDLEIQNLTKQQEERVNSLFGDQTDMLTKNKSQEDEISKLQRRILVLDGAQEEAGSLKTEISRLNQLIAERSATTDKLRAENQLVRQDLDLARGLVVAREQEIAKLNQKNNELIKLAQDYSHLKQMLEIARKDIETYKEAYESRERLIFRLEAEIGKMDALQNTVAEKNGKIAFLEEEIKRFKEKIEEKDTQLEIFRSRMIDQELERFKSAELANHLSQLRAKNEFLEQKITIKEGDIADLQKKLVESNSKIQELQMLELKLEQVGSEREDLIRQIYELKQDLLEIGRLKKQLEQSDSQNAEKGQMLEKLKERLDKSKTEVREAKEREEDLKNTVNSLQKEVSDLQELKTRLSEVTRQVKEAKEEAVELRNTLQDKEALVGSLDSTITKLKNELKETAEKHKTKMAMLASDNAMLEDRVKKLSDVEKKLEKSLANNGDLKNSNEILQQKVSILSQELKGVESAMQKVVEANTALENRINILKEVENKNKTLLADVDSLQKEVAEVGQNLKKSVLESTKLKEDLERCKGKAAEDKLEAEKKEVQLSQVMQELTGSAQSLQNEVQQAHEALENLRTQLEGEKQESADWRLKYTELEGRFQRYVHEYELMSCKYDRMSAVNADHIKDIENKAFTIAQLQKRLLVQMIELARVDFVRNLTQ